jgi:hypothetical protein
MTYSAQAQLSQDIDFMDRIAATAAVESPKTLSPKQWAYDNIWWIAAAPGFADSYSYALETGVERPGNDPAVITDEQILSAVQARVAEIAAEQEPPLEPLPEASSEQQPPPPPA